MTLVTKLMAKVAPLSLAATLVVAPVQAETYLMSSWIPPVHPLASDVLIPWAEEISKVTDGRVKVRILPKSVGSPPQQYDVARDGQADIVYGNHSYTPGVFSIYGLAELPRNGGDPVATSVSYWRAYSKAMQTFDEMPDVKLLSVFTHGPGEFYTNGVQVTGMTGNSGIKMRGGGIASTRVADTLGMTSVQAPISQAAEMMANGIVNGIAQSPSGIYTFKFEKYLDNRFTVPGGLYNVSFFVAMNKDKWNALSPEDQQAIEAISGEALARRAGEMWKREDADAYAKMQEQGYKTTLPEGEFADQLNAVFDQYEQDWITSIAETGLDGAAMLKAFRADVVELASE
jgi:TRAP-type C4-dicarboxylate transport system substrate-binding protein